MGGSKVGDEHTRCKDWLICIGTSKPQQQQQQPPEGDAATSTPANTSDGTSNQHHQGWGLSLSTDALHWKHIFQILKLGLDAM